MAKIHILAGGGNNVYTAVIHAAVPAANNTAGTPWSDALKNSGMATTVMTVGNGPGQISNNEATNIANGALFEAVIQWQNDPNWTTQQRAADLDQRASDAVAEKQAELQAKLALFGATRN